MTQLFVRTLREDPADAELPSHKLLVRAGYVRRVAPGIYTWLPLGLRVFQKIENIAREEMNAIGAQEVRFPCLLPREPYEASNRWYEYGDNLFRLQDRKKADYLLGPTNEEMFALLVKDLYSSYKDLPLFLYHIQLKYRDEARPRGGLLRGREFVMKDSYSFDVDAKGLKRSYEKHREAYINIFNRLGLEYSMVNAMSGAMGGSQSEEFLIEDEFGEDTFVRSPGGYAANVEAIRITPPPAQDATGVGPIQVIDTPNTGTIVELVDRINAEFPRDDRLWIGADTLKNVVFKLRDVDGKVRPVIVGLPGDREVDEKRLEAAVSPAEVEAFTDEDFAAFPQLIKGYIGPVKVAGERTEQILGKDFSSGIEYLVDPRVVEGTRWVTGANSVDQHQIDVVYGRDFVADGVLDVAEVREGDPSPDGSGPLTLARGIECGHIFQLGTKYAQALGLKVLDQNGKLVTVTMGSYGFGVSRAVAVIAGKNCDERGLVWPRVVAPFDVHIVAAGKTSEIVQVAEDLAAKLAEARVEVLLDDRNVSPGVKFADAELIGVPTSVVVGRRLADGVVEIKDRATLKSQEVPVGEVFDLLLGIVRA